MAFRRVATTLSRSAIRAAPIALAVAGASGAAVYLQPAVFCAPAHVDTSFVSQFQSGTPLRSKLQWLDDAREDLRISREQVFQEASLLAERYNDDAAVLYRAARAAYDVEQLAATPSARKKELIDLAMKWITEAKARERSDAVIYRWSGILLQEAGKFGSTKDSIKNSFVIRDDWQQAVAINPYDANALHLLGRWHQTVAGLSWIERKLASTLFAEPPTATYEEALHYYKRAEDASPGFWIANCWRAAETCLLLNRKDEALEWIRKGLKIRVAGQYDLEGQKGVLELYKKLDRAAYDAYMKENPNAGKATVSA